MKNIKLMALLSLLCLLILIPSACAMDNQTTIDAADDGNVLTDEYYFDSNIENDTGNGTQDNPYKVLTADRIKDNSVIHLNSGQYSVNQKLNLGNVTIIGQNPENTIITTNGKGMSVSKTLILINVTILNSNIVNSGDLYASNTIFDSSQGYKANNYGTFGGAIYANANSYVHLENATFINNWAKYGGAIYMKDATLEIYDSLFMNNYALLYGGAIAGEGYLYEDYDGNEIIERADIIIDNTQFLYDYSLGDAGGALYLKYASLDAYKLNATGCNATFGGAITLLRSNADIGFAYGFNNTAKYDGGFIYQMYDSLTVLNSTISNNVANNGAGLFVDQSDDCIVANNTFSFNHANICAGAIYQLYYGYFEINNTYYNNSAMVYDDLYQTYDEVSMDIGDGNYTLYVYDSTDIGQLPSKYDLRELNQVTPIKDQGKGGNCWAFACIGVLESCILKASGDTFDFSEENMKNLFGRFSDYGWTIDTNDGGYPRMAYSYLVSWMGPVLESEDPYSDKSTLSPVLNSAMHVQNILFLKRDNYTDNDAIKKAIMTYGGVNTPIHMNYQQNQYYAKEDANHAVAIVGWDDTKIISGAPGPGAWIVRNSWGSSYSYFYVSYYDKSCAPLGNTIKVFTFILNDTIKYDKNYQYDVQGLTDFLFNSTSTVWYKNVFEATDDEYLAAVSTYFQKDTDWQFSVYVNDQLKTTQSGFSHGGYYTFNLNEIIPLNAGDVFEVEFKITVDGDSGVPISESCSFEKDLFYYDMSYLSCDGINWMDLYDLEWTYPDHSYYGQQVACIKAFTILNPINTTVSISVEDSNNPALIRVSILNEYGHPVSCGNVTLNVEGKDYVLEFTNGVCEFYHDFKNLGDNVINASFEKTGFISSFSQINHHINKGNVTVDMEITKNILDAQINVRLSKPIDETIFITVDKGTPYEVNVTNGIGSLSLTDLYYGNHDVEVNFTSDSYDFKNATGSFTIDYSKTFIQANNSEVYYNDCITYSIRLVDMNNNPIANKLVIFTIGNVSVQNMTGNDGIAYCTFKLNVNSYTVNIYCPQEGCYFSSSQNKTIKVKSTIGASNTRYTYNSAYKTTLLDSNGKKLANKEVSLTINKRTYSLFTDKNGIVSFNLCLSPGTYDVSVKNLVTGEVKTQKITVVKRITNYNDLTMYYGAGKYYKVRVYDDNGNVLKNARVAFKINGKTYYRYSNSNGYASFKINLKPAKYTITAEYKGYKVSNKVTVKTTIIAKNAAVKKGKVLIFSAKLLNSNGKIIKYKFVTFKFKGKTYKIKTNGKGIAILKVRVNYKVGKYSMLTTYSRLTVKNIITVKK